MLTCNFRLPTCKDLKEVAYFLKLNDRMNSTQSPGKQCGVGGAAYLM